MFGGVGFLLHGDMLVGVWKGSLIVRPGPDNYDDSLRRGRRRAGRWSSRKASRMTTR